MGTYIHLQERRLYISAVKVMISKMRRLSVVVAAMPRPHMRSIIKIVSPIIISYRSIGAFAVLLLILETLE